MIYQNCRYSIGQNTSGIQPRSKILFFLRPAETWTNTILYLQYTILKLSDPDCTGLNSTSV